ncbi:MAG: InlB B-repeat-containing protein, partial [Clostridiales bacterium]|nr:InlB B-repeat-containing protein [Clostridiales bacterium]
GYGTAVVPAMVNWNTTAPTPETTRTGYNFTGWLLPDGTQYVNQPITQDTTLTAKWEVKKFTVTFYVDGAVYKALEVEYGTVLQNAMTKAKVVSYQPFDSSGARLSRYASTITEDTNVLLHELTGWEKYGDFVGRSPWYTWLMVGLGGALALAFSICVVLLVKWRK